jgi:hypothetical protein
LSPIFMYKKYCSLDKLTLIINCKQIDLICSCIPTVLPLLLVLHFFFLKEITWPWRSWWKGHFGDSPGSRCGRCGVVRTSESGKFLHVLALLCTSIEAKGDHID